MGKTTDLLGKSFGRLTVVGWCPATKEKAGRWECLCTCGTTSFVAGAALRSGATRSCGCLKRELDRVHGMSIDKNRKVPPEYDAYMHAKYRCTNPNASNYERYGGRGIKFLFTSFEQFFLELGRRPKGKSLDRKDNNGNYEPGNVRWATSKEQANNRRKPKCT
jgi:hypothetical protein